MAGPYHLLLREVLMSGLAGVKLCRSDALFINVFSAATLRSDCGQTCSLFQVTPKSHFAT